MGNWIKVYRNLLEWEWYGDPLMVALFLHLLLKANHKDKKYRGAIIKRGQLVTGRVLLAEETGLSVQQVRTCLTRLKSTSEITSTSTSKGTVLTIVRYNVFQESEAPATSTSTSDLTNEQPAINQQSTSNQPLTRSKEVKKERSKEVVQESGGEKTATRPLRKSTRINPLEMIIPDAVDSQAWTDWVEYKAGTKKPVNTKRTATAILNVMARHSPTGQQAMVEYSIQSGYPGLYEDQAKESKVTSTAKRDAELQDWLTGKDKKPAYTNGETYDHGKH